MERLMVLAAAVALSGCIVPIARAPTPVSLPDGTKGYALHCPGRHRDISDCMNQAAQVCGGKYQILGNDKDAGPTVATTVGTTTVMGARIDRTLIVSCAN